MATTVIVLCVLLVALVALRAQLLGSPRANPAPRPSARDAALAALMEGLDAPPQAAPRDVQREPSAWTRRLQRLSSGGGLQVHGPGEEGSAASEARLGSSISRRLRRLLQDEWSEPE